MSPLYRTISVSVMRGYLAVSARSAVTPGDSTDRGDDTERRTRPEALSGANRRRDNDRATNAPATCAMTKPRMSAGRIPAKVSDNERAIVMAGLAKDVEAVNQ